MIRALKFFGTTFLTIVGLTFLGLACFVFVGLAFDFDPARKVTLFMRIVQLIAGCACGAGLLTVWKVSFGSDA